MRKSGVLLHVSSLPGEFGCGAFGSEAKTFIDTIADGGFGYWQVLPFTMPELEFSPYKSYSAFAGNPWFIDLNTLRGNGLLTDDELRSAVQRQPYSAEHERLGEERVPLLKAAAARAGLDAGIRGRVSDFVAQHPQIEKFCRFMTLKEVNGMAPWSRWTDDRLEAGHLFAWQWIQYEFSRQWAEIKAYANKKGIKIIGDIPIYVYTESADVWGNRELFMLDDNCEPTAVAGCPPDYFAEDGQLWGNPLFDWAAHERQDFAWWRERVGGMFELFDGVRFDHFRGFESYWAVPAGEKTAKNGKWVKGPGEKFVDMVVEVADGRLVIAEDLGEITPDVERLVEYSGFPGMRVIQFGFMGDCDSTHQPHNYVQNCVAYSGTHDNNTCLGYLWELTPAEKRRIMDYCGYSGENLNEAVPQILRELFASVADTVIFPLQDLLCYGRDTRMNTPGIGPDQWRFRVTGGQIRDLDTARFKYWNRLFRRDAASGGGAVVK